MTTIGSVVLAGGGTAGHVNPLLAVADELRAREPGVVVTALGVAGGLEDDLVPARGYPLRHVPRVPLPRRPSAEWVNLPGRSPTAAAALGIPAVYVPLPIGNGEQRLNAGPVVAAGGGLLVDDAQLDAAWVAREVPALSRCSPLPIGRGT